MFEPPAQIKQTAILQLISGILTMTIMMCVSWTTLSTVSAVCTLGLLPICGIVSFLLVPIGIFEIVCGILGLTNPKTAAPVMKICSYVEMASILFGGVSTAIAGGVAMSLLGNTEVTAYLEG